MTGSNDDLRVPPRRHSDLRIVSVRWIMRAAAALGGRRLYRRTWLSRGCFQLREEEVRVPDLPDALEGFTIAQLTDVHAGPFLSTGDLADVVATVVERAPDLCVLTGDYLTDRTEEALAIAGDLGALRARHGVYAIFGNHDYRGRREGEIERAYGAHGIRFLRDACERIEVGGAVIALVGLEDLEEAVHAVDVERARADVLPSDVEIVLCHNPAGGPRLARPGCAAVLSGHTHGGQIDLPWVRHQGPPHPGDRVQHGDTALITSRGLGVIGLPLRVGAPAEVVWIRLTGSTPD